MSTDDACFDFNIEVKKNNGELTISLVEGLLKSMEWYARCGSFSTPAERAVIDAVREYLHKVHDYELAKTCGEWDSHPPNIHKNSHPPNIHKIRVSWAAAWLKQVTDYNSTALVVDMRSLISGNNPEGGNANALELLLEHLDVFPEATDEQWQAGLMSAVGHFLECRRERTKEKRPEPSEAVH